MKEMFQKIMVFFGSIPKKTIQVVVAVFLGCVLVVVVNHHYPNNSTASVVPDTVEMAYAKYIAPTPTTIPAVGTPKSTKWYNAFEKMRFHFNKEVISPVVYRDDRGYYKTHQMRVGKTIYVAKRDGNDWVRIK